MNVANIRAALPEDAEAIARVHVGTWLSTYRGLMPDRLLDGLSVEARRDWWAGILREPERNHAIVAEEQGSVIGFALYGRAQEVNRDFDGELYAIYILAEYQQKGIGRRLVGETASGLLRLGIASMLVWVLSTNPARQFYEKLGGKFVRSRTVEFSGAALEEAAYGWSDLRPLAGSR